MQAPVWESTRSSPVVTKPEVCSAQGRWPLATRIPAWREGPAPGLHEPYAQADSFLSIPPHPASTTSTEKPARLL